MTARNVAARLYHGHYQLSTSNNNYNYIPLMLSLSLFLDVPSMMAFRHRFFLIHCHTLVVSLSFYLILHFPPSLCLPFPRLTFSKKIINNLKEEETGMFLGMEWGCREPIYRTVFQDGRHTWEPAESKRGI